VITLSPDRDGIGAIVMRRRNTVLKTKTPAEAGAEASALVGLPLTSLDLLLR
jgi:hypothetical protein